MRKTLRAVVAAMTVIVCLLLCWQAVDLCRVGNLPENFSAPGVRIHPVYSLPAVRERLSFLAPALWAYGAVVALALVWQAVTDDKEELKHPAPGVESCPKPASPALRALLYAAAIALIALGVMNGGLRDVLIKAINICTECIGLG